jgi:2-aminoadipate transaminase
MSNSTPGHSVPAVNWDSVYAGRTARMKRSAIRELLKLTMQPDIISFAGGLPAPEMFPVRAFEEACQFILRNEGKAALQYGPTEGYPALKQYLVERMNKYGVPAEEHNILLTNGSQQALDLIGKIMVDDQCIVCTERPTYLGAIQAWNAYDARYCTVPLDDDGMVVEQLPEVIERYRPKFVYVLPNFHNPAGVSLSEERRHQLVEIVIKYDVFIVEDDPYGELRFEGEDLSPLVTLAKERTLYLCTFSKTLSPGIRLGWIVAPQVVISKLVQAKQGTDLHTSTFLQMVANDICQRGILRQHVKRIRATYKERRDTMLDAMAEFFPDEVRWTRPAGGLFLWVKTPEEVNTVELLQTAVAEKVAYVPGNAFYPDGNPEGLHTMRLNFSYCPPEIIAEGIRRLGVALKKALITPYRP